MNLEQARSDVSFIFERVLHEVDPERLTRRALDIDDDALVVSGQRHELRRGGRIVLLGVGKSAIGMARGVESILGDRLDHGLVVTKRGLSRTSDGLQRTTVRESSHPVPDQSSVDAGNRLLEEAFQLGADDLAIVVVSGGGSSLVESPIDGVSLSDFIQTTSLLLGNGADIWTLNAARRRLSQVKAGGLARTIAPARVVNLILSDVLGNPLGVIASGLSVAEEEDDTSRLDWLRTSRIWRELPVSVRDALDRTTMPEELDTSKVVQTIVVGDADLAANTAVAAAQELGYRPFLVGTRFAGDAREFGRFWAQLAVSVIAGSSSIEMPACIVGAGEMTVVVRGNGTGGRNSEMAAAAAFGISGLSNVAVASLATDGDDGSSQAAGGVVTGETILTLVDKQLTPGDFLDQNNTRAFLDASGGLIVTGQTGTNVNDLYLALVGGEAISSS